jgi:hypothetical protein
MKNIIDFCSFLNEGKETSFVAIRDMIDDWMFKDKNKVAARFEILFDAYSDFIAGVNVSKMKTKREVLAFKECTLKHQVFDYVRPPSNAQKNRLPAAAIWAKSNNDISVAIAETFKDDLSILKDLKEIFDTNKS